MSDAPTLNGLRVVSARLLHPWRGAWIVDATLDPDTVTTAPTSGPASVVIGGSTLIGTIDPRGSGSFVAGAAVRVVGGAGGWDKAVPPQHYHVDNGVSSTSVYTGAAAIVGETIVEAAPTVLGIDYMRSAGPASRVFGDADWYLDLIGLTHVGPRPAATADASLTLISWDPVQQRAELTCDALLLPGTTLSDPRLNGATPIVRDVEQTFDARGSRIVAWCASKPVSRLAVAMTNLVREFARTATLKIYKYRIVIEGSDGRLQLQAVNPTSGMPDTLPLSAWPGMSGDAATYKPSTLVLVHFVEGPAGTPPQPVVLGFDPSTVPLKRSVDATVELDLGPSAALVALAGGGTPLVLAPWATSLIVALDALAVSLSGFTTGPLAPLGAIGDTLTTNLQGLPSPATTKTVAA